VIGERVSLGYASDTPQRPYTIVGVVGPGTVYPGADPVFLRPVGYMADTNRKYPTLAFTAIARLASDASHQVAESQAAAAASGLPHSEPTSVRLVPLAQEQLGDAGRPLWLLFDPKDGEWVAGSSGGPGIQAAVPSLRSVGTPRRSLRRPCRHETIPDSLRILGSSDPLAQS
jgi:hypothetical protein